MKWHLDDFPHVLLHLPKALHDLIHHEDQVLVSSEFDKVHAKVTSMPARGTIVPVRPDAGPASLTSVEGSPKVSVEKTMDPIAQRSARNIGLLMNDYLHELSSYDVSKAEGEKLIDHWREIMLRQPERLASAHPSHWHEERLKEYWHDRLSAISAKYGITAAEVLDGWDDWKRASGTHHMTGHPLQTQAMNTRQWQDLVIRTRMHHKSMDYTRDC